MNSETDLVGDKLFGVIAFITIQRINRDLCFLHNKGYTIWFYSCTAIPFIARNFLVRNGEGVNVFKSIKLFIYEKVPPNLQKSEQPERKTRLT